MRWLDGIIDSMDMSLSKLQEIGKDREAWRCSPLGHKDVGHNLVTEQQQNELLTQKLKNLFKNDNWATGYIHISNFHIHMYYNFTHTHTYIYFFSVLLSLLNRVLDLGK